MYSAQQVAKFILGVCNVQSIEINNLRLQYLLYVAQIGYLTQTEESLYKEDIVAFPMGPQVREVYFEYCAYGGIEIDTSGFTPDQCGISMHNQSIIYRCIAPYLTMKMRQLCDMIRAPGGAWSVVFDKKKPGKAIPIYLLQSIRQCPNCGNVEHLPNAKYCMLCGTLLPAKDLTTSNAPFITEEDSTYLFED